MKVVYMEQTLAMIAYFNKEEADSLVKAGQVKQTESGIRYLLIEENESTTGN